MRSGWLLIVFVVVVAAAGCSGGQETVGTVNAGLSSGSQAPAVGSSPPELDAGKVGAGKGLYSRFCASCHGEDLAGDPDWKVPNKDGSYRPPPQDSSGHTWHHGDDLLVEIILEGSDSPKSRMPRFEGRLTEADVLTILEFFKSTWGPQERAVQWEVTLRERTQP